MENPWLSPWLSIPLEEYEGHMALPEIGQAQMLAGKLEFAVRRYSPKSIAIVGCAGGNGLDRLVGSGIERIVGIDINPAYVEMVSRRFRLLAPAMRLLGVDDVKQHAVAAVFSLASSRVVNLRSGKDFVILCFGKD